MLCFLEFERIIGNVFLQRREKGDEIEGVPSPTYLVMLWSHFVQFAEFLGGNYSK